MSYLIIYVSAVSSPVNFYVKLRYNWAGSFNDRGVDIGPITATGWYSAPIWGGMTQERLLVQTFLDSGSATIDGWAVQVWHRTQ